MDTNIAIFIIFHYNYNILLQFFPSTGIFVLLYSHSKYTKNTILLYFSSLWYLMSTTPPLSKHFYIFVYCFCGAWPISKWKVNFGGSRMNHSGLKAGVIMHPLLWEHQMYCPLPFLTSHVFHFCQECLWNVCNAVRKRCRVYEMGVCEELDCQVLFTLVDTSCGHQPVASHPFLPCVTLPSRSLSMAKIGPGSSRDASQVRMSSLDYNLQYFRSNFEQLCVFCM